jgi:hypothetical protein
MSQRKHSEHEEVSGQQEIDVLFGEELEEDVETEQGATGDDLEVISP